MTFDTGRFEPTTLPSLSSTLRILVNCKQGSRMFPLCYSADQTRAMICDPNVLAKYCPIAFIIT